MKLTAIAINNRNWSGSGRAALRLLAWRRLKSGNRKTDERTKLVLDNITGKIVPADQRSDLAPVYSFNASDLWLAKSRGRGQHVGNSDRIGLWRDLRKRMEIEEQQ